jgi:hypothetical protein
MSLLRILFGLTSVVVAIILALSAVVMFNDNRGSAIFLAVLATIFGVVGRKWLRGRTAESWRDGPATEKQKSFANDLGIRYARNITKGELSDLIGEAKD